MVAIDLLIFLGPWKSGQVGNAARCADGNFYIMWSFVEFRVLSSTVDSNDALAACAFFVFGQTSR